MITKKESGNKKDITNCLLQPIIFIGPGRSGSTIISEFIMMHEDLGWISNYHEWFPYFPMMNVIRRFTDNKYWRLVGEKGQINKTRFLNGLLPRPAEAYAYWDLITPTSIDFSRGFLLKEKASIEEIKNIRSRFYRLLSLQGKSRLSFKITGPGRISYLHSIFPDAIFINVVRDINPIVNSFFKVDFFYEHSVE